MLLNLTPREATDAGARVRLWWLIAGRALLSVLMFAASLALRSNDAASSRAVSRGVFSIVAVTLCLSVVYALLLRLTRVSVRVQSGLQLSVDALLVTGLVLVTGGLRSPYTALFIGVISLASLFRGARGALAMSVLCASCYVAAMLSTIYDDDIAPLLGFAFFGGKANGAEAVATADAVQIIGLNTIGFFVVALLASRLAERNTRTVEATNALARLRALHERIVESIRSGVVTTDLSGVIFTFNRAAEEMTGFSSAQMRGRDASFIFGDLEKSFAESARAAHEGERSPRYESEMLTPEGFSVRLGFSIFPLSAEGGERSGYVITFQDLTELRALEETARRQDRLAAVGRLAAGIAHEIRNPLASISGSVQVLKSDAAQDSMQAELMDIIVRESQRLNRIINDYLAYARPRAIQLEEIDLREPLNEVFALMRHSPELHPAHRLEIITPDEEIKAYIDADSFKQVFNNLARNSLKAMPQGGKLTAELKRTPANRAQIIFTDEGVGMSAKQVERLFEPFAPSTTGGTGLGLSIVYQIVRDHSGTINVRSQEAEGTTITIEVAAAN